MPNQLSPEIQRALAARVQFYRDLGIQSFYRRGGVVLEAVAETLTERAESTLPVIQTPPAQSLTPKLSALRAIREDECETCSPFLLRQIQTVQPKVIVALGAVAAKNLLGVNDSMANLRGHFYDFRIQELPNTKLIVTYHPAYLLRDPRQKAEAWKDLQIVMRELGMAVPKKSQPASS